MVCVASEIWWSNLLETALTKGENASGALSLVEIALSILSDSVLRDQPPLRRKKIENLVGIVLLDF